MHFEILATDFDGTLARHTEVDATTLSALQRVRDSGRRTILVTGRELENFKEVFSRFDLFDIVVAENGAVLYHPAKEKTELLHDPPPARFVADLRARGVPVTLGHVVVSSREPHETVILDVIKVLGLEMEIIFNKGAVMVLPAGVNKATGLLLALHELNSTPEKTVAIGDAENDHSFLSLCGCAVAVNNALPSLKEHACLVTRGSFGAGVVEVIDRLLDNDLADIGANPTEVRSRNHPRVLPRVRADACMSP
jgi:hydroxymethylpyrimidine pyrophosphatase-like HAD family hydrolase